MYNNRELAVVHVQLLRELQEELTVLPLITFPPITKRYLIGLDVHWSRSKAVLWSLTYNLLLTAMKRDIIIQMENFYQRWGRLTYSSQVSRVVCVALASVGCGVACTFNGGFSGIDYASFRHYLRWESARTRSIYMLLPPPLFQLLIFVPPIPALHSESLDH